MRTVTEVCKLTGVSVRTLRHYDAIGLLKPTQRTASGYRLYDDTALCRLQTILLFRKLQFPLKEIKRIMDTPGFDQRTALEQQIRLLELQRKHLKGLISYARQIQETGVIPMDFSAFDNTELDQYAVRVKAMWGKTEAYQEFRLKTADQTQEQMNTDGEALMRIFAELGAIRHLPPESDEAQTLIAKLQSFITEHYYACTPEILRDLGRLYTGGGSMTDHIERVGGVGTAEFVHQAIETWTSC